MSAIDKIYSNEVGISFFWKREQSKISPKMQLIFRDIGFLLTLNELRDFSDACKSTQESNYCNSCKDAKNCRSLLLRTPSEKIDLAISTYELDLLQELIQATIFKVELKHWIATSSLN